MYRFALEAAKRRRSVHSRGRRTIENVGARVFDVYSTWNLWQGDHRTEIGGLGDQTHPRQLEQTSWDPLAMSVGVRSVTGQKDQDQACAQEMKSKKKDSSSSSSAAGRPAPPMQSATTLNPNRADQAHSSGAYSALECLVSWFLPNSAFHAETHQ